MKELDGLQFNDEVNVSTYDSLTRGSYGKVSVPTKSKWHVFYWLKWHFVVRQKLQKELDKAIAESVDEILNSDPLAKRMLKSPEKWEGKK